MLPNKIIPIPNADKEFHEKWTQKRNMLNFPHPFRAVIFGPPNCGKSTTVKNIILRADPPFERIVIIHCDAEQTAEYDDLGPVEMLSEIPDVSEWDGIDKTMVVIDDVDVRSLPPPQQSALDRLFGYVSTHKNISPLLCSQDPFNVPKNVRAYANVWILFKLRDRDSLQCAGRRAGVTSKKILDLFDNFVQGDHDSIWIDYTRNTPYPLRLNGYKVLSLC